VLRDFAQGMPSRGEALRLAEGAGWPDEAIARAKLRDPGLGPVDAPAPKPTNTPDPFDEPSFVRKSADEMGIGGDDFEKPSGWYRAEGGEQELPTGSRILRERLHGAKLPRNRSDILSQILEANGIMDHDSARADAAYRAWKAKGRRGPKPTAKLGGILDAMGEGKEGTLQSGFEAELRGAKSWADVERVLPRLADALGVERLSLPQHVIDALHVDLEAKLSPLCHAPITQERLQAQRLVLFIILLTHDDDLAASFRTKKEGRGPGMCAGSESTAVASIRIEPRTRR
jgi:hypothetical protein